MSKEPLKEILTIDDISGQFEALKDDGMHSEVYTLGMLQDTISSLVESYGRDTEMSVELIGDEYTHDWIWNIINKRTETPQEQKVRLKEESNRIKKEKAQKEKEKRKKEEDEKKTYLKLKKKYES